MDYQGLSLHGCTSMFITSFPASGFDITLSGMPNFDVILRLFVFELGHSSLVVPIRRAETVVMFEFKFCD